MKPSPEFMILKPLMRLLRVAFVIMLGAFAAVMYFDFDLDLFAPTVKIDPDVSRRSTAAEVDEDPVKNGIHVLNGLAAGPGYETVRATCTACHSAKLVTQNRATREGWASMIKWMQETQGLWDLGPVEDEILDYLAKYYAPKETGRRPNLDVEAIEWYILEL